MSAPAVKPALPAPSGAQAPRVGSGAPNTSPSGTSPGSATAPQKLPPSGVGVSMSVSPVKPSIPPNANHAVSTAVPLSLVQEHKAQGNALPQPPVALPRTPEKPKDLVPTMAPPPGPKPTSNGVEGSPGKAPLPAVQLPSMIAENKKTEDAVSATPMLNHSADNSAPASAAGPTSALASTPASNTNVLPPVPAAPVAVSSNTTTLPSAHSPAVSSQQSPAKPELVSVPAAANAAPAMTASSPASAPPVVVPPKSNPVAPATNSSSPAKCETSPAAAVTENKSATPAAPTEDPVPAQPPAAPASGPGPGAAPASAPASETVAKPAPPAPPEVTKTRIEISKPEFKVATTPRISKRKRETKPLVEAKVASGDPNDDRKSRRVRIRTQPYQSPLPELQYREIAKIKNLIKGSDDKLIVFYKNEFLAVRNAEGSFYVCQAMQNIYKSSTRIRIRWLSQDKKDNKDTNVYIPDFYDVTEFDCILTNLELKKLDKNKYQLPQEERDRTQNILKRALDVEKGVGEKPPITEEHPDGLDLSLYRDEAQLKKKRSSPKASKKAKKAAAKASKEGKTEEGDTETSEESQGEVATGESEEEGGSGEKKKVNKPSKSKANKKEKTVAKATSATKEKRKAAGDKDGGSLKKERTSERGREREATKRRAEAPVVTASAATSKSTAAAKPPPEKKAKVAATPKPARKAEKAEPAADASLPTRATKSRSAKTAAAAAPPPSNKTSPVTRTKERERRGVSATGGRKKPGKKA